AGSSTGSVMASGFSCDLVIAALQVELVFGGGRVALFQQSGVGAGAGAVAQRPLQAPADPEAARAGLELLQLAHALITRIKVACPGWLTAQQTQVGQLEAGAWQLRVELQGALKSLFGLSPALQAQGRQAQVLEGLRAAVIGGVAHHCLQLRVR